MADAGFGFNMPFDAQIDYLRAKLALPTSAYDDIKAAAHDRAFVVAGAAKADLVADLQAAMVQRATDGRGLNAFTRDFEDIVAKHGWTGWTGEDSAEGQAWRARVIYQPNMSTSYWAGRRKQMLEPEYLKLNPYWMYVHSDTVEHPRPLHMAWHGITLPHDHPFWQTHFTPNGYGCQCRIVAVSAREGEDRTRAGWGELPKDWDAIDPKTGAPVGIDKGFDHAPGAASDWPWQRFIDDKLLALDAPIGAAMWQELRPVLAAEQLARWVALVDATVSSMRPTNETVRVYTVAPATVQDLANTHGIVLDNAAVWMRDTDLLHALRNSKVSQGTAIPLPVWRDLPRLLEMADPYLDTTDQALVYAIDLGPRWGKVVVRANYNEQGRFDGARAKITSNFVQTGGMVLPRDITLDARYLALPK